MTSYNHRELDPAMPLQFNRLPQLAAFLLGVLAMAALGWQGYRFYNSFQASRSLPQSHVVRSSQRTQPKVHLASLDLFGKAQSRMEPQAIDTRNLPKTNLQLTLRGVMAGNGHDRTSALVEGSDNHTQEYHLGDTLPGHAKLKAVYSNRIVISRNGHLENLFFPKQNNGQGLDVAAVKTPPPSPVESGAQAIVNDQSGDNSQDQYNAQNDGNGLPNYGLSPKRKAEIQAKLRALRERLQKGYQ